MKLFGPKKAKSSHGDSYYKRENIVHTLGDLKNIYTPKGKIQHITEELIMYNNMALSEISEKVLHNAIGEAHYIIKSLENMNNYKILFYRHSVEDFNYLMQFHFCENTFLFVNNMVRSSYVLGNKEKKSIMNRIQEKYYPDIDFDFSNGFELQINDAKNNFLYTTDSVNFSITYINNTNSFKDILNKTKADSDSENKFEGII